MQNHDASRPSLSVILSAMGTFAVLEHTIERLWAQTIHDQIELVLVGPSQTEPSWATQARARFHSLRLLSTNPFVSIGESNALGVRNAAADVVAFGEDHSFPEPDWAAALVASHSAGWDAVGPQVSNANPASGVSRADFLIGYGPWATPCKSGEVSILPGHNSSYKKALLLEYQSSLAVWLQAETVLHYDLTRRGKRLYLESQARTAHVNFSRFGTWFGIQRMQGRVFASQRSSDWPLALRILFAAASPLIPAVRLFRITRDYFAGGRTALDYLATFPYLTLGLAVDGVGQFVGYSFGAGKTVDRLATLELRRIDHITKYDRDRLFPSNPLQSRVARDSA